MTPLPCLRHPGNAVTDVACAACGDFLCPSCTLTWAGQARCPACYERAWATDRPGAVRRGLQALLASFAAPLLFFALLLGAVILEEVGGVVVLDDHPIWVAAFGGAAVVQLFGSAVGVALAVEARRLAPASPLSWGALAVGGLSSLATISLLLTGAFA